MSYFPHFYFTTNQAAKLDMKEKASSNKGWFSGWFGNSSTPVADVGSTAKEMSKFFWHFLLSFATSRNSLFII